MKASSLTGVEPGPRALPVARRSAGDDRLGRGARRRRSQEQGPVPRQGRRRSPRRSPAQPTEVAKTEWRYGGISYTDTGIALLSENDRASRRTRTWIMEPGAAPRKVWDRKQDAAYDDPGSPVTPRATPAAVGGGGGRGGAGGGSVIQNGDYIYRRRRGRVGRRRSAVPRSSVNIKTLKTERIFRSSSESLESFVAPLNDEMTTFLTRYETQKDAPNYYIARRPAPTAKRAVTQFKDPQPPVRDILRQYVTYKRKDGVTLSGHAVSAARLQAGDEGAA